MNAARLQAMDRAGEIDELVFAAPGAAIDAREQGEASGYRVFKDGDQWCAVGPDFIDLQQSPAGFADTPGEALEQLMKEFGKEWAKKKGEWVKRARIASREEAPAAAGAAQAVMHVGESRFGTWFHGIEDPLAATPAPEVTEAMVTAYLKANDADIRPDK